MRNGELYQRQPLVRHTKETGSGLWLMPTPTTNPEAPNHGSNSKGPHNLKEVALTGWKPGMTWPTPTVCGNYNKKGLSKTSGDGLATAVAKWPTPQAHNAKETNAPNEYLRNTPSLTALVHTRAKEEFRESTGGKLNPTWVEWLMGWPLGWTDLKPLETDKYQQWQQQHGIY
jgi:hypothetical protein